MHIRDSKLVIITESKNICFDLPKDVDNNWKYEISFIVKQWVFSRA